MRRRRGNATAVRSFCVPLPPRQVPPRRACLRKDKDFRAPDSRMSMPRLFIVAARSWTLRADRSQARWAAVSPICSVSSTSGVSISHSTSAVLAAVEPRAMPRRSISAMERFFVESASASSAPDMPPPTISTSQRMSCVSGPPIGPGRSAFPEGVAAAEIAVLGGHANSRRAPCRPTGSAGSGRRPVLNARSGRPCGSPRTGTRPASRRRR